MITIYAYDSLKFGSNGLGVLLPSKCTIQEEANGMYELDMEHPMDEDLRYTLINVDCILRVPAPKRYSPFTVVHGVTNTVTYTVDADAPLYAQADAAGEELELLTAGQVVTLMDTGVTFYLVSTASGECGYATATNLTYADTVAVAPDESLQTWQSRYQLFRIYKVEKDTGSHKVHAWARHIFYDLLWRTLRVCDMTATPRKTMQEALDYIDTQARPYHKFKFYTDATRKIKKDYGQKNVVEALLDPDDGLINYGKPRLELVRDNFNVFFMVAGGKSRNDPIMHGRNLLGVTSEINYENIYNRIYPIGQYESGLPLYWTSPTYVDSPSMQVDDLVRAKCIEYSEVKVGDDDEDGNPYTIATARDELERLALAEFTAGMDLPEYNMSVKFVLLGDTEEYITYRGLDRLYLWDTVQIIDTLHGITLSAEVTAYTYDVLVGRYTEMSLGKTISEKGIRLVSGYQIRPGSLPGVKLAPTGINTNRIAPGVTIGIANQVVTKDATAPATPYVGQMWLDTDTELLYRCTVDDPAEWAAVQADELHTSYIDVATDSITISTGGNLNLEGAAVDFNTTTLSVRDGDEALMELTADGMTIGAGAIACDNFLGNVINSGGGDVTAAGSIQTSIDNLPHFLTTQTTITVPSGKYIEDIAIEGFKGAELHLLLESGAIIVGNIIINECEYVKIYAAAPDTAWIKANETANNIIYIEQSTVELYNINLSGKLTRTTDGDGTNYGIYIKFGRLHMTYTSIERTTTYCLYAIANCTCYLSNNKGGEAAGDATTKANRGRSYGVLHGTVAHAYGLCPASATGTYSSIATLTLSGSLTDTNSSGTVPVDPEANSYFREKTGQLHVLTTDYWKAYDPVQGVYHGYDYFGMWTFAAVADFADVSSATLTIRRYTRAGPAGDATIVLHYHGKTSAELQAYIDDHTLFTEATALALFTDADMTVDLALGETATIPLSATALAALQAGTLKGFGVINSGDLAQMHSYATLDVQY
jgi:phage minor structural protein